MKKIFLSDLESWNKVLEEESTIWVRSIIVSADLDEKIVFGANKGAAVEYLVGKKTYIDFDIKTSSIKIQKDGEVIGEWRNPSVSTKIDELGTPFAEISVDILSGKDKQSAIMGKMKR